MKEKHMTYNELKESANLSTTIYQWKKNSAREATRTPSLKSIEKICDFFQISMAYFFADTDNERLSVKYLELMSQVKLLKEKELDIVIQLVKTLNEKTKI